MASSSVLTGNVDSDYGSDFDTDGEQELVNILKALTRPDAITTLPEVKQYVLEDIEQENDGPVRTVASLHIPHGEVLESAFVSDEDLELELYFEDRARRRLQSLEVEYAESSRKAWTVARPPVEEDVKNDKEPQKDAALPDPKKITSPLKHFRTAPKKPLSVTDLISPAWCELQYFYNLAKFGRKRRTPAMKQGSAVHKVLEQQVHKVVEVEVKSKEDGFGLRIWNIIQGLRTLRATGITRELELWGVVEGQVVNGIVDVLSYTCPDPALEEQTNKTGTPPSSAKDELPPDQTTLTEFYKSTGSTSLESHLAPPTSKEDQSQKVYITDVKTRQSSVIPGGSSMRPTIYQLMLYRSFLAAMAMGVVDAKTVFSRYGIKSAEPFSDAFISEIAALDLNSQELNEDDPASPSDKVDSSFPSSQDSAAEFLGHNSVMELWSLMTSEFTLTFPNGADSVGLVMGVEFRQASNGAVMGKKNLVYDETLLTDYVQDEMRWWRGEREPKGVDIEEAGYKCRICEFAEGCTWRKGKLEDEMQKIKLKKEGRSRSLV